CRYAASGCWEGAAAGRTCARGSALLALELPQPGLDLGVGAVVLQLGELVLDAGGLGLGATGDQRLLLADLVLPAGQVAGGVHDVDRGHGVLDLVLRLDAAGA